MVMTASQLFSKSASGSLSEEGAARYDMQMREYYTQFDGVTGWLKEALDKTRQLHDTFMSSRMWEFSKIVKGEVGTYVGAYEIGYLGSLYAQRNAAGFMCDILMSNPTLMSLKKEERIDGFACGLHKLNFGIGEENYFYRKVNDGMVTVKKDAAPEGYHIYLNSRDKYAHYKSRERIGAVRAYRATDVYVKNNLNPTSNLGEEILTVEQVEAAKAAAAEEYNDDNAE